MIIQHWLKMLFKNTVCSSGTGVQLFIFALKRFAELAEAHLHFLRIFPSLSAFASAFCILWAIRRTLFTVNCGDRCTHAAGKIALFTWDWCIPGDFLWFRRTTRRSGNLSWLLWWIWSAGSFMQCGKMSLLSSHPKSWEKAVKRHRENQKKEPTTSNCRDSSLQS